MSEGSEPEPKKAGLIGERREWTASFEAMADDSEAIDVSYAEYAQAEVMLGDGDFGEQSIWERFGHLFGAVDDLPGDLSTNPDYMSGFGENRRDV